MSLYKMFEVSEATEQKGILLNYGNIRLLIARAGGSNKKFVESFKDKSKPFEFAIKHGKLEEEDSIRLMAEVYAETIVLGWESVVLGEDGKPKLDTKGKPKFQKKIENKDGKMIAFSVEACTQILMDLPELFRQVQEMSGEYANFLKDEEAAEVGNLSES
jgi:hypothetical protein